MRGNNGVPRKQDGSQSSSSKSKRPPQTKSDQKTQPSSGENKGKIMAKSDPPANQSKPTPQKIDATQGSSKSANCGSASPVPKVPKVALDAKKDSKLPAVAEKTPLKTAEAVPRSKIQSVKLPRAERGYRENQIADMEKFLNEPSTAE